MLNAEQNETTPASPPIMSSPLGAAEDNTFADLEPALDLSMFAGPLRQTPASMADGYGASMPFAGDPLIQDGPDDREGHQEQVVPMVNEQNEQNEQNEITPASPPIIPSSLGAASDTFAYSWLGLDPPVFAGPFWQTPAPMADGFGARMPFVRNINPFVQNVNGFRTLNNQGSFYQPELLPFFVAPQDNGVLVNLDQETGPADMNDDFTGERL